MAISRYNLTRITLFLQICVAVFAASSTFQNQIWWSKRIKTVQQGCAGMCCKGQNGTCYGTGPKMAGATSSHGRCYCDESCLKMKDCCEDYSLQCQAVDCVVGGWSAYSPCSKPCGIGTTTRTRQVTQEPRNGGLKCPTLKESRACVGKKCKSQRHLGSRGRVDRETARIMPATYGQFRGYTKYNAHMDIRKNLFYKYYAQRIVKRKGYCATYEITSTRLSCSNNKASWSNVLSKGTKICVECQPKAMGKGYSKTCIGHGSTQKDTFWTAVDAHGCHGWWRRVNELQECSCRNYQELGFIFV